MSQLSSAFTINLRSYLIRLIKPKFLRSSVVMLQPRRAFDIGIANNLYREFKAIFPSAIYNGIDYFDAGVEMDTGHRFIVCDLESDSALDFLHSNYDLIIVSLVLEHLTNGQQVFSRLCGLLAPRGVMYVEFPSIRSAYHLKSRNSYHFHDNPTHKAFYRLEDLANIAVACRLQSR